jgi:hypothetical protein
VSEGFASFTILSEIQTFKFHMFSYLTHPISLRYHLATFLRVKTIDGRRRRRRRPFLFCMLIPNTIAMKIQSTLVTILAWSSSTAAFTPAKRAFVTKTSPTQLQATPP